MSRLSKAIFTAPLDLDYEDVDVPEWGVKLRVQEPDADRRADLAQGFVDAAESGDNVKVRALYPALLIATCVDPEDGTPVFAESDAPLIGLKEGKVVDRLATIAMRLAGLDEQTDVESGKDDSSTTPSGVGSTG
jgi:hypothetical protein